jgi:rubrerythrin
MQRGRKIYRPGFLESLQCRVEHQRRFIEAILKGFRVKSMLQAEHKMNDVLRENLTLKSQQKSVSLRIRKHLDLIKRMENLLERLEESFLLAKRDYNESQSKLDNEIKNNETLRQCYRETIIKYSNAKNDLENATTRCNILFDDRTMYRTFFHEEMIKRIRLQDDLNEFKQQYTCAICLDRRSSIVLLPCRHSNFCQPCIQNMHEHTHDEYIKCPLCRTPAESFIPFLL